ncbi:hypothetical protein ACFV7Q_14960 [Streptomyces sp. NPDC059851]|uniref:hypothetical protein n=1 Tax=Streptomyces sp. NPDC059851 TaxID=3346971 RepID=UPI0036513E32
MSIAEERPLATDKGHPPAPRTPTNPPSRPRPARPPEPTGSAEPAEPADAPASTTLAMASIRISRGNPTPEETAAVAALLMAGLRRLHETGPSTTPTPRPRKLPHRPWPTYRAPGSWAS